MTTNPWVYTIKEPIGGPSPCLCKHCMFWNTPEIGRSPVKVCCNHSAKWFDERTAENSGCLLGVRIEDENNERA